jgi:hypothetical protein
MDMISYDIDWRVSDGDRTISHRTILRRGVSREINSAGALIVWCDPYSVLPYIFGTVALYMTGWNNDELAADFDV